MSQISTIAVGAVTASRRGDQSLPVIALFCGVGLLVSLGLIAFGIDLGPVLI
jgi:hypothetical protein